MRNFNTNKGFKSDTRKRTRHDSPVKNRTERPRSTRPDRSGRPVRSQRSVPSSASAGPDTSWQPVSQWYNSAVGEDGHFYHRNLVLPKTIELLNLPQNAAVLDLACGQGVLARVLPEDVYYQGIDIAPDLIKAAREQDKNPRHHFTVANITRSGLPIQKKDFTHVTILLALQNIDKSQLALNNAAEYLREGGKCLIVINHPCFRIPRQSSWEVDPVKKTQFRRVDRYLSPLEIPITAHPGQKSSPLTWSFHQPLSVYTQQLFEAGFLIERIEEWVSTKQSVGTAAKMENRGRSEIPLFMTFLARKA